MKAGHALVLVASHLITLGAGIWVGVEFVRRLSHFGALESLAMSQSTASVLFSQGPSDAARDALIRNLDLLDRLGPTALPSTELTVDRLVTLVRLWKVEVVAGRTREAEDYRVKVQHVCETAKWRDCSDGAMDRLISRR